MKYACTCTYCGNSWEESFYFTSPVAKCGKCGDSAIKFKETASKNIFGYETEDEKERKHYD